MTSVRTMRTRRWSRAFVGAMALVVSGCGTHEDLFHGVRFTRDGTTLVAASLMPSCSCMTLASTHQPGGADLMVVSRFYGEDLGQLVLSPGKPVRLRFDWAGERNDDVYQMSAFALNDGKRGNALVPMQDHVIVYGDPTPTSCHETSCAFGTLNLSRAWSGQVAQGEVEVHERGVQFARGDQLIELAASTSSCGCALLRNATATSVLLQGRLRGRETGTAMLRAGADLNVAYDWAGAGPDDIYTLAASSVTEAMLGALSPPGLAPIMRAPGATAPTAAVPVPEGESQATALKIRDYATIIGHLDHMTCDRDGTTLVMEGAHLSCPYGSLSLNQLLLSTGTDTRTQLPPASAAGAAPAPTAPAHKP